MSNAADVEFHLHAARGQEALVAPAFHHRSAAGGDYAISFHRCADGYLIRFPDVADFLVHADGRTVHAWPVFDAGVCAAVYEQQILPLVLAHQGARVYHGGAVAIEGRAVVVLGPSGQGKSTLVAAFARRGFAFLSDDCLVVEAADRGLVAIPQTPVMRMWHDSARTMAGSEEQIHYHPGSPKPRVLACANLPYCGTALPVSHMLVLGDSNVGEPMLTPLSPADAVIAWASNAFILDLKDRARLTDNLRWAAEMVSAIPAHRLDYPRRYDVLDAVVDAVLAQFGTAAVEHAAA